MPTGLTIVPPPPHTVRTDTNTSGQARARPSRTIQRSYNQKGNPGVNFRDLPDGSVAVGECFYVFVKSVLGCWGL